MLKPDYLQKGDKIAFVATARKIKLSELQTSISILNSWGLEVVFPQNIFGEYNQFSGTIEQRVNDIQMMIDSPDIKAIYCVRGGYGTVQIIDYIDFSNIFKNPKWIIGFSDVTVLHSHLNNLGVSTLHSTMPINFEENNEIALKSLYTSLFGYTHIINTQPNNFNKHGKVKAEVVGGNLSILYSLIGSKSDIDTSNKILFLEDLDEYLYHLDRMMMNLKRTNKFLNIKGLIIGSMSNMKDNQIPYGFTAEEIINTYVRDMQIPICFGFPSGHIRENNSIKLGIISELDVNKNIVTLCQ